MWQTFWGSKICDSLWQSKIAKKRDIYALCCWCGHLVGLVYEFYTEDSQIDEQGNVTTRLSNSTRGFDCSIPLVDLTVQFHSWIWPFISTCGIDRLFISKLYSPCFNFKACSKYSSCHQSAIYRQIKSEVPYCPNKSGEECVEIDRFFIIGLVWSQLNMFCNFCNEAILTS